MLEKLEAADAWTLGRDALAEAAARFDSFADRIPFDTIEGWLVLADPARSNPFERGYTGAIDWMQPRFIGQGLQVTGFDVIRSYIFGDALAERSGFQPLGGMPTYGGYAIGYHVVPAFLKRSGLSIEEATFLPADEIVQRSGFFT
ncbi:MAG TPA: DUF2268 domain-containing putative Zn-dependent protease [Anaerolineae bacterium]